MRKRAYYHKINTSRETSLKRYKKQKNFTLFKVDSLNLDKEFTYIWELNRLNKKRMLEVLKGLNSTKQSSLNKIRSSTKMESCFNSRVANIIKSHN